MRYDLVFEGGGARGFVFVGALRAFFEQGHTFDRLVGTSAGAITVTLLAAGYQPQALEAALNERDSEGRSVMAAFLGEPAPFSEAERKQSALRRLLAEIDMRLIPDRLERRIDDALADALLQTPALLNLFNFVERGGWYAADNFVDWLRNKLKLGEFDGSDRDYSEMTLAQFAKATGVMMTVIAADTTGKRKLILNANTAPDCPVVYAVRMSMSVPLLWQEVVWQPEWGRYRGADISGHAIVDGGLLSSFPIELLISTVPQVTAVMGEKRTPAVLGFLIDEQGIVPNAPPPPPPQSQRLQSATTLQTVQRLRALVDTMTQAHDKEVYEAVRHLVVTLPSATYTTTEFDMSSGRREALVEAGYVETDNYFRNPPQLAGLESIQFDTEIDRIALRQLER